MADLEMVAYLVFRSTNHPEHTRLEAIERHADIDLGRQMVKSVLGVEDRCVSTHHIRIHCVVYDDPDARIAPMVYMRVKSSNGVMLRREGVDDVQSGGIHVDREMGDILLNPGDIMRLTATVSVEFGTFADDKFATPCVDEIQHAETTLEKFQKSGYRLTKRVLGCGSQGAVYVAVKTKTPKQFACKVVPLLVEDSHGDSRPTPSDANIRKRNNETAREYNVLKRLSHPNIIGLEKVFRTTFNIYIFEELITGGDLMSHLERGGQLPEPQAAVIVRQLLEAVKYLHDNQVVHRDIKPENILVTSWRDGARIVLTDFGQSRTIVDMENAAKHAGVTRMTTTVGTYGYAAPEIQTKFRELQNKSGYSQAIDIWSVGCVTGILLTNEHIFPDGEEEQINSATLSQFASYIHIIDVDPLWEKVSRKAKDFLRGCLVPNENDRRTASQCLQHEWFQHPSYKAEFDAAYKRAVQDWRPKDYDGPIVEVLDTKHLATIIQQPEKEIRSHHFAVQESTAQDMAGRWRTAAGLHASPVQIPNTPPRHAPAQPSLFRPHQAQETPFQITDSLIGLQPPGSEESFADLDESQQSVPQAFGKPPAPHPSDFHPPQKSHLRNVIHR